MDQRLTSFVKDSLSHGLPREDVATALVSAGWPRAEVDSALSEYAEIDFPVPVPVRRTYGSAKEAFLYLLLYLCLYVSALFFGTLLFQFINRLIPDPLDYQIFDVGAVRVATSALIVAYPLYLWLTRITERMMSNDPLKRTSPIREWLTYITLFIAAAVIIIDLIVLVFNLLQGELTPRFALRVLTVLLIAGLIFGYYLWDLGQKRKK